MVYAKNRVALMIVIRMDEENHKIPYLGFGTSKLTDQRKGIIIGHL